MMSRTLLVALAGFGALAAQGVNAQPGKIAPRTETARPAKSAPGKPPLDKPVTDVKDIAIAAAIRGQAGGAMKRFYVERSFRPLWARDGRIGPAAETLLTYLASAQDDALKPSTYRVPALRDLVAKAQQGSNPAAIAKAELRLSETFARYVQDQRRAGEDVPMIYADEALAPRRLRPEAVLRAAAFPDSFTAYMANMGWMSPLYVRLRALMEKAHDQDASDAQRARLERNLDRARLLPGPWTRHVVVDASSGRLFYYEAGKEAGMMKVVVGASETQTPLLAGMLQWAILNPYWNVPTYLARKSIAPRVLAGRSLNSQMIEALSDWGPDARKLTQAEVNWPAVAAGTQEVRLRELPGGHNAMGKVKFLFPNDEGIYLHDTPDRDLLKKDDRHFSNGCIRLENAAVLGRWLLQKPIATASKAPEQAVPLPVGVPVYLTYLTATATEQGFAFRDDVYGRDK